MKRLIIISIFLFSSILLAQSELNGTWLKKDNDGFWVYTIYKTRTGQYVEGDFVKTNNNESRGLSPEYLLSLGGGRTKELYNPWIGDSFTEIDYYDKERKPQTRKKYYKLIDDNMLLTEGEKYKRSSLTVLQLKKKYKNFNE